MKESENPKFKKSQELHTEIRKKQQEMLELSNQYWHLLCDDLMKKDDKDKEIDLVTDQCLSFEEGLRKVTNDFCSRANIRLGLGNEKEKS